MSKEEMTKYAFTCMVKDNPDEAIKTLILYDEEINILRNNINKVVDYLKDNPKLINDKLYKNDKDTSFIFINNKIKSDLLFILGR